jgi:hypothetical protein
MASKKKKKTKVKTSKAKAPKTVKASKHRKCTVCRKLGHNKRSHERGGTLNP